MENRELALGEESMDLRQSLIHSIECSDERGQNGWCLGFLRCDGSEVWVTTWDGIGSSDGKKYEYSREQKFHLIVLRT